MQKLTTKEPTDDMIEVGMASVEAVFDWRAFLTENFGKTFPETEQKNAEQEAVAGQKNGTAASKPMGEPTVSTYWEAVKEAGRKLSIAGIEQGNWMPGICWNSSSKREEFPSILPGIFFTARKRWIRRRQRNFGSWLDRGGDGFPCSI